MLFVVIHTAPACLFIGADDHPYFLFGYKPKFLEREHPVEAGEQRSLVIRHPSALQEAVPLCQAEGVTVPRAQIAGRHYIYVGEDPQHFSFAPLNGAHIALMVLHMKAHPLAQGQHVLQRTGHIGPERGADSGGRLHAGNGNLFPQAFYQLIRLFVHLGGQRRQHPVHHLSTRPRPALCRCGRIRDPHRSHSPRWPHRRSRWRG